MRSRIKLLVAALTLALPAHGAETGSVVDRWQQDPTQVFEASEVDLAEQRLRAWQGERLVMETHVSSGRNGRTPSGNFRAGPYKSRMHYSKLYDNAPMPWSVQVNGNVFIHGFSSVPDYPASHGCIRVPLNEGNPARFFYEWIDVGTPVRIRD